MKSQIISIYSIDCEWECTLDINSIGYKLIVGHKKLSKLGYVWCVSVKAQKVYFYYNLSG